MNIKLTSYLGNSTSLNLQTTADGNRITTIESNCFKSKAITNIKGDSILNIKENAFYNCTSLTTAYFLSTSYVTGGYDMFSGCSSLTSIYVPASMVNTYKTMQYWSTYASKIVGYN